MTSAESMAEEKKQRMYRDIYDDSLWLINLVENLLAVTKIEDGTMHLKMTAELLDEVIDEALRHISRKSAQHQIKVIRSEEFLLAKMDARLIMQVIINIVENAIKYTPEGSRIEISSVRRENWAVVTVADNGPGIPNDAKPHVFDMFYTSNEKIADCRRSLGLGLALCKSIITAHGGEITVFDNHPHGSIFQFTLPTEEVTLHE